MTRQETAAMIALVTTVDMPMAPAEGKSWQRALLDLVSFDGHGALVLYLLVFLFPMLFMGRILSANDIYGHYDPWRSETATVAQNPTLHDPAMAWLPIFEMARNDLSTFHWNPYIASGIPGWGSAASAIANPVVLPILLVPPLFFYAAMVLWKLLVSYALAYGWLREEGFSSAPLGLGALVVAAAGPVASSWLWQSTNATVLYAGLLWILARAFNGKKTSLWIGTFLAVGFALSGFPATTLFGLWLALFATIFGVLRTRSFPFGELGRMSLAGVLGGLISLPLLVPFVRFVRSTGYLSGRESFSTELLFPIAHLRGLVDWSYVGSPVVRDWIGLPGFGGANNPTEISIYLGFGVLALALISLSRPSWRVVGWSLVLALALWLMFGMPGSGLASSAPGLKYSPMTRLRLILAIPAGLLVASGLEIIGRRARLLSLMGVGLVSIELALFAGGFYPWLEPAQARVEEPTEAQFLAETGGRVMALFDWMQPNTSQLYGIRDIRSQWSSTSDYRALLRELDPASTDNGTVIRFNPLTADLESSILDQLNVEWIVEPPAIDIVRWQIEEKIERPLSSGRSRALQPGETERIEIEIGASTRALELKFQPEPDASGEVAVWLDGREVTRIPFDAAQPTPSSFVEVPVSLRGTRVGVELRVDGGEIAVPLDESGTVLVGQSSSSLVRHSTTSGSRIYRRLTALPAFRLTAQERRSGRGQDGAKRSSIEIVSRDVAHTTLQVSIDGPAILVSPERIDPDLRVRVDGEVAEVDSLDGLFAAVNLSEGTHEVAFDRRMGRGYWPVSFAALIVLILLSVVPHRFSLGSDDELIAE